MYVEGKFAEYLNDLASNKPAPGGGSAAAAAGAVGLAALSMVANFTVGKDKYKDVEAEMRSILAALDKHRARLQGLVDEDVAVYKTVSAAYKLPKETDDEKKARTAAIQQALKTALTVPLAICRCLNEAADLCEPLLEKGNRNLASDVAVGAELMAGAFESAWFNVEINLAGIKDENLVATTRREVSAVQKKIRTMKAKIAERTKETIN